MSKKITLFCLLAVNFVSKNMATESTPEPSLATTTSNHQKQNKIEHDKKTTLSQKHQGGDIQAVSWGWEEINLNNQTLREQNIQLKKETEQIKKETEEIKKETEEIRKRRKKDKEECGKQMIEMKQSTAMHIQKLDDMVKKLQQTVDKEIKKSHKRVQLIEEQSKKDRIESDKRIKKLQDDNEKLSLATITLAGITIVGAVVACYIFGPKNVVKGANKARKIKKKFKP